MKYDFLIVGAGLFGAVFAQQAKAAGKTVLVIDKRSHIGGNVFTEEREGIQVHKYGAHIFHTNDKRVWDYVNRFAEFNRYTNSPVANYHGQLYSLPFNMHTFYQMWGVITPQEAMEKIEQQRTAAGIRSPKNLEEQAISLVGTDIYEKLVKGYTQKQWGRPCRELPAFIIRRLPVRFTFDNNYFNARYQGIPVGGYTRMVENMLEGIPVQLNEDYLTRKSAWDAMADQVVYTGPVDAYLTIAMVHWNTAVYDLKQRYWIRRISRETPLSTILMPRHPIPESSSISISNSAHSPKPLFPGSILRNDNLEVNPIIQLTMRKIMLYMQSTKRLPTGRKVSSSVDDWPNTAIMIWMR